MPAPINIHVYSDALVLLGTAGIIIPLVHRFGLNPVLGYLGAGGSWALLDWDHSLEASRFSIGLP